MDFDFEAMPATNRYKIIISTVVPRPIAWVTTNNRDGGVNAAPYSFFNAFGNDPPIVVVGVNRHADNRMKDTGQNILEAREFVINLVGERQAEAMNVTAIDSPTGVDELKLAGLGTEPSIKIGPPRIAGAPVAFECRLHTALAFGPHQAIVVGQIVHAHVADDCVLDRERCHIDTPKLGLVGRMHGSQWYTKTNERFAMDRLEWKNWKT
jgi:flavin reductase (DIM6/NTAB) family NADH-FMN oxidoreductase RutF